MFKHGNKINLKQMIFIVVKFKSLLEICSSLLLIDRVMNLITNFFFREKFCQVCLNLKIRCHYFFGGENKKVSLKIETISDERSLT